jgi:DHA1 family bicyclomycin/chloramphenicol resistance-like MFS transporter
MGLTFIGGFGMCSFFAFLASSSFVYIGHFGLTPMQYSFAFSINAVGFIGASQLSGMLGARFGLAKVVVAAVAAYTLFACILFAVTALGVDSLPVLVALLFMTFAFLGLVIPSTMVLSLEEHGPIAGSASALGGTLQMLTGGAVIAIAGLFFNGTSLPMVITIALTAVAALVITMATLRPRMLSSQLAE